MLGSALPQLYARSPVWAQNVACSVEGLRKRLQRFPPGFDARVQRAIERLRWTPEQRAADRVARLRDMLVHAGRHVPYWRELFAQLRFQPQRVQHVDELQRLPTLTKDVIIEQGPRMWAEQVPERAGSPVMLVTSGTTGAGLVLRASSSAVREQWAMCWRHRLALGITRRTWCAQLGGQVVVPIEQQRGPFVRVNVPGRQVLLSGYHLGPHTADAYLDEIERRELTWIHGYPSLVVPLATAALERGRRPAALRFVTVASENLAPWQRQRIVDGLGVPPRDLYAQTEAIANACEWPDGVLRLDDDFSVVELLRDPAAGEDELRRVLGTSLDQWHQPFIRYDTGDLVRVDDDDDGVAPGRRLRSIDGRDEDYVERLDGVRVGRLDHVFKTLTFVHEAQIRQREPGAIAIHVVPRVAWTREHEQLLRASVAKRLGPQVRVQVVIETALPRTARGKLRLVVREG